MKKRLTDIQIDEEIPSHRILFLNGAYFDSVDAGCIPKLGLRVGLEIEAEVLQKLIDADEGMRAKNYALELLTDQSYSKSQMGNQLHQKGFGTEAIEITLEDLEQLGHIKDESFAKKWVARRQRSKPKGKRVLAHELANHNIDRTTVDRVLGEIQDADETKLALQVAQQQAKRYQSLSPEVAKRRLHGFLLRRGFDYETIQSVIDRVSIKGTGP
ncbi:regulatory protein RecX [Candidatus Poribacteria bacterium]|nr:regulatory protein RecX [Candidatus Poribacteria bacterium]